MKEFIVKENDANQRFDRWLTKAVPLLPSTLAQKYFRRKRFKCNGKATKGDYRLVVGDSLSLYINDEFFEKPSLENAYLTITSPRINVIYEDAHIILLDKPAGLVVHHDEEGQHNTLIAHLQAYLYQTHAWKPREEASFVPALCNRIDRNTSGIVIAAKSAQGLREMNDAILNRALKKEYLAVIHGELPKKQGKLEHFLLRDKQQKLVRVYDQPTAGAKTAITHYDSFATRHGLSLVGCQLITGRTHQIRAQFAHIGHPLLGDGKYGSLQMDKPYQRKYQALCSYRLSFPSDLVAEGEDSVLTPLAGKKFQVREVEFLEKFFPDFSLKKD